MCKAGYYLSAASGCAVEIPCGAVEVYCPEGSGAPLDVDDGYYTTPVDTDKESKREGQRECEAGYYCTSGRRRGCDSAAVWSTKGAKECNKVTGGWYSTGGSFGGYTRTGESPCEVRLILWCRPYYPPCSVHGVLSCFMFNSTWIQ